MSERRTHLTCARCSASIKHGIMRTLCARCNDSLGKGQHSAEPTPAPWHVIGDCDAADHSARVIGGGRCVAECSALDREANKANAHLIARLRNEARAAERRGMERAARLVCRGCRDRGLPRHQYGRWLHGARGGWVLACHASRIWDVLAADALAAEDADDE